GDFCRTVSSLLANITHEAAVGACVVKIYARVSASAASRRCRQWRHDTSALTQYTAYRLEVRYRPRLAYSGTAMVLTSSHSGQFCTCRRIISSCAAMLKASTVESRNGA